MVEEVIMIPQPWAILLVSTALGAMVASVTAFIRFALKANTAVGCIPRLEKKIDANTELTAEIGKSLAALMPTVAMQSKILDENLPIFRQVTTDVALLKQRIQYFQDQYKQV